ncbi:hypothetical protein LAZ67_12001016 [Cordylochernes scorpioides]|uniref:Uncharacterized protein n=1 Tax=Cordylochernes scorpioides TaxID=51811 RepID=A0ABY6L1G5_9ARAC|nr:hypothetical protein LAZ67_12001016 [Cordylochernes scorpioides]
MTEHRDLHEIGWITEVLRVLNKLEPTVGSDFKRGRTSLEDDLREGQPKTTTTLETIEKIHNIVLDDRRVKLGEIAEAVGISEERVRNILHEELGM